MNRALSSCLFVATLLPACSIYTAGMFDDAGSAGGSGGGDASGGNTSGGGTTSGGASGGGLSTGGTPMGSGASGSGGASGGSDTGGTGSSAATGGGGTGGAGCTLGSTPDYDASLSASLFDTFDSSWPRLNDGSVYDGYWSVNSDAGAAGNISPLPMTSDAFVAGDDYVELCDAGDLAMHIQASHSNAWGVGYDAKLLSGGTNVNLSAYTGIIFYARSENATAIKISLTDAATPSGGIEKAVPPLSSTWKVIKVPFSGFSGLDKTKIAILKVVMYDSADTNKSDKSFDLWIDDIGFYK